MMNDPIVNPFAPEVEGGEGQAEMVKVDVNEVIQRLRQRNEEEKRMMILRMRAFQLEYQQQPAERVPVVASEKKEKLAVGAVDPELGVEVEEGMAARRDDHGVGAGDPDVDAEGGEGHDVEEFVDRAMAGIRQSRKEQAQILGIMEKLKDYREEERHEKKPVFAITILPEEAWEAVLRTVADPRDSMNLAQTCQLFRKINSHFRHGWLLEFFLPYFYRHLSKQEFLSLRLVRKEWNRAILGFVNNHPSLRPHQEEMPTDLMRMEIVCPPKQLGLFERSKFNFSNGPRDNSHIINDARFPGGRVVNPFVAHYVSVKLGNGEFNNGIEDTTDDDWWGRFFNFLSTLGHHIRYFNLTLPDSPNSLVQKKLANEIALTIIPSLPNMRKLLIEARRPTADYEWPDVPLPESFNLETIELKGFSGQDTYNLHNSLLMKYGQQLKKLRIDGEVLMQLSTVKFPILSEMCVDVGSCCRRYVQHELSQLNGLQIPKLTKLHIHFSDYRSRYRIEDLVILVNNLSESSQLSTMRLSGEVDCIEDYNDHDYSETMAKNANLKPTGLKTMEIELEAYRTTDGDPPITLNFLAPWFEQVEYLILYARNDYDDPGMEVDFSPQEEFWGRETLDWIITGVDWEVVQVHKYLYKEQMFRSNIWELMPKLRQVSGQWSVCSRQDYEAYKRQG